MIQCDTSSRVLDQTHHSGLYAGYEAMKRPLNIRIGEMRLRIHRLLEMKDCAGEWLERSDRNMP